MKRRCAKGGGSRECGPRPNPHAAVVNWPLNTDPDETKELHHPYILRSADQEILNHLKLILHLNSPALMGVSILLILLLLGVAYMWVWPVCSVIVCGCGLPNVIVCGCGLSLMLLFVRVAGL